MSPPIPRKSLLIIDDDRNFCRTFAEAFESERLTIHTAHDLHRGSEICRTRKIDLIILDEQLPDGEGHNLCPTLLAANDQCKIIFITAYPSFDHALKAIKAGAYDYLSKPLNLEELKMTIERALQAIRLENVQLLQDYRTRKDIERQFPLTRLDGLREIQPLIRLAAANDSPVLITGETGTGKNVAARTIHHLSSRSSAPFVSINCAALPESLIEAELFGYEKGAFTGAVATHKGIFEMAEGGTLFLDEIGSLPLHLQGKLLGVLDDWTIRRLGGQVLIPIQIRVIFATNSDLNEKIAAQTFRSDLYYRINVLPIHLPPLRNHIQDIPILSQHLIAEFTGGAPASIAPEEIEKLKCYDWPGNIRELRNVIERALILHGSDPHPSELICIGAGADAGGPPPPDPSAGLTLATIEQQYIERIWRECGGNLARTAKSLGISLSTLKRKIKQYRFR